MDAPRPPRISHLDLLRGVATLGILLMNALTFALWDPAYYRLDADGWDQPWDRVVGVASAIAIDQKMMGLFSLLFGASIVLFVERASANRRHPVLLSLWRNALLLAMGIAHTLAWDGDVLTVYALCAPLVLLLRKLPVRLLYGLGGAAFAASVAGAVAVQATVAGDVEALGWFWIDADLDTSGAVLAWVLADGFLRALGMMLIGVGLYRTGALRGAWPAAAYRRLAVVGFAVGLPFAIARVAWQLASGFDPGSAITSTALGSVATIPMTLGLVGLLMSWSLAAPAGGAGRLQARLRAVGQMALTNYLSQTALGLLVLAPIAEQADLGRATVLLFVAAVWAAQLTWSPWWLARFTNGPIEWLWRVATYLRPQPLRRRAPAPAPTSLR